jgi:hypothetical protein
MSPGCFTMEGRETGHKLFDMFLTQEGYLHVEKLRFVC